MMMKELYSELGVVADFSALEMRASATPNIASKGIKHGEIDLLQNTPFSLNEAAEMRRGADVRTELDGAYPSRSSSSANASMCGPLIPPRNRRSVLGAEKYVS